MASYITCHDIAVDSAFSRRLSRVTDEGADGNGKQRKGVDGGRTHHESEHERRRERGVPESRLARCACGQRGDQGRVRRREPAASHHERSLESPRMAHSLNGLSTCATTTAMSAATRPTLSPNVDPVLLKET